MQSRFGRRRYRGSWFGCRVFRSRFRNPEPSHVQGRQEDQSQHRCYGQPADNRKRHGAPEYGRRNRDHAERRCRGREQDGAGPVDCSNHDGEIKVAARELVKEVRSIC